MRRSLRPAALMTLLAALAVPAQAAYQLVRLQVPPAIAKDVGVMPQIFDPADEAERRINTALRRLDGNVRKAAKECKTEGGANSSWERSVDATMRGPRFLSLAIVDNAFCGGAHPNTSTMAIVYELTTGAPVDWKSLLPPALTGTVALATGADGTKMVTLASKRLHALYLKGYRPRKGGPKAADDEAECRDAVTNIGTDGPPAMMAWLDAKTGGLAAQFDLPHVVQACADAVTVPTATLRQEGAQAVLTDALDAAHQR